MAGEIEKINEIFRIHDEKKKISDEEKPEKENTSPKAGRKNTLFFSYIVNGSHSSFSATCGKKKPPRRQFRAAYIFTF